MPRKLNIMLIV
jgi:hypothetical protein